MPHGHERLSVPAGDRGVGDLERVGLDAAAVVLVDRRLGDLLGRVGEQLLAGRGELGEVVGEGRRDRPERARCDLASGRRELRLREVVLLGVLLELGADDLDAAAGARADRVEQLLAADAARVTEDDDRARPPGAFEVVEHVGQERVVALLDGFDPDQPRLAEQGGAREREQLARRVVARVRGR